MATNSQTETSQASALASPSLPASDSNVLKWPDTDIDRIAIDQAIAELGRKDVPLSKLVERAQEIKTELQARKGKG